MRVLLSLMLVACIVGGCGPKRAAEAPESPPVSKASPRAAAPTTGAPLGSIKVGDKAACVVCAAEGRGHGEEEAKATLDYKGKTYAFCSEAEKAKFISNPSKYTGGGK